MAYVNMKLDRVARWSGVRGFPIDAEIAQGLRARGCKLVQREHISMETVEVDGRPGREWFDGWRAPKALALLKDLALWAYGVFGFETLDAMRRLAPDEKFYETIAEAHRDERYESVFMRPRPMIETEP